MFCVTPQHLILNIITSKKDLHENLSKNQRTKNVCTKNLHKTLCKQIALHTKKLCKKLRTKKWFEHSVSLEDGSQKEKNTHIHTHTHTHTLSHKEKNCAKLAQNPLVQSTIRLIGQSSVYEVGLSVEAIVPYLGMCNTGLREMAKVPCWVGCDKGAYDPPFAP